MLVRVLCGLGAVFIFCLGVARLQAMVGGNYWRWVATDVAVVAGIGMMLVLAVRAIDGVWLWK